MRSRPEEFPLGQGQLHCCNFHNVVCIQVCINASLILFMFLRYWKVPMYFMPIKHLEFEFEFSVPTSQLTPKLAGIITHELQNQMQTWRLQNRSRLIQKVSKARLRDTEYR